MLFVSLGKVRAGTSRERISRRASWTYPDGLKVIGEYWLQCPDPVVVVVCEAEHIGPIMAATTAWDDAISWTVVPAVTADEGLQLAKAMA